MRDGPFVSTTNSTGCFTCSGDKPSQTVLQELPTFQWKHCSAGLEVRQHVAEGDQIPRGGEGGEKEKCCHYQKEFENVKIDIIHPRI